MNRFDYIRYDQLAISDQAFFKDLFMNIEFEINKHNEGRAKSLALTALEEAYMWVGKMIRDEQIRRTNAVEPQESRINS